MSSVIVAVTVAASGENGTVRGWGSELAEKLPEETLAETGAEEADLSGPFVEYAWPHLRVLDEESHF